MPIPAQASLHMQSQMLPGEHLLSQSSFQRLRPTSSLSRRAVDLTVRPGQAAVHMRHDIVLPQDSQRLCLVLADADMVVRSPETAVSKNPTNRVRLSATML